MFWTLFAVHLSAIPLPRLVDPTFSFIRILFVLASNFSVKNKNIELFRVAKCSICLLGCMDVCLDLIEIYVFHKRTFIHKSQLRCSGNAALTYNISD